MTESNIDWEGEEEAAIAVLQAQRNGDAPGVLVEQRANAAWEAGRAVADLVREKQLAYGDASGIQRGLWRALLEQYRDGSHYLIPVALFDHVPRLTRVFDRVARIVSNPVADRMGEDPWRDLAGDAVVGIVMPRTCAAPRCELDAHPDGTPHRRVDAAGVHEWY